MKPQEGESEEVIDISERRNVILMLLYSFYKMGREEVSLPEFLECAKMAQEKIPLKYEFSERFLYSLDLLEDLRYLEYVGFAHRFAYKHDAFLPKRYITLTEFGRSHIKRIAQKLPEGIIQTLDKSVLETVRRHEEKFKLFARPVKTAI